MTGVSHAGERRDGRDLGRVLFCRREPVATPVGLGVLAVGAAAAVVHLAMGGTLPVATGRRLDVGPLAPAVAAAGFAVATLATGLRAMHRYEFCERGVRRTGGVGGVVEIAYEEAETLTYALEQVKYNGMHVSTKVRMEVGAGEGAAKRVIRFECLHKARPHGKRMKGSDEIDAARDRIAMAIAEKWLARIERGEEVAWTPRMALSRRGVRVLKGRHAGRDVALEEIARYGCDGGRFRLYLHGEKRPVVECAASEVDLLPGLFALARLAPPAGAVCSAR